MASILNAHEVTKQFGGLVAVDKFSVEIEENSISAIIGPNGAGKTTFFNCITGFYQAHLAQLVILRVALCQHAIALLVCSI